MSKTKVLIQIRLKLDTLCSNLVSPKKDKFKISGVCCAVRMTLHIGTDTLKPIDFVNFYSTIKYRINFGGNLPNSYRMGTLQNKNITIMS
jgi:hypothetical protein